MTAPVGKQRLDQKYKRAKHQIKLLKQTVSKLHKQNEMNCSTDFAESHQRSLFNESELADKCEGT